MHSNSSGILRTIRQGFQNDKGLMAVLLFIGMLTITPILQSRMILTLLWIIFIVMFHFFARNADKNLLIIWKLGLCFLFLCFIYKLFGVSSASMPYCIQPITFFLPVYGLMVINNRCNSSQIKLLFHALTFLAVVNIADGIRLSVLFPMEVAFQSMAEELELEGIANLNLGGSMFVNMTLFLLNVLIIVFYNTKDRGERLLFAIYIFIDLWFIIMCSYKASVVVFAIASILLQYIAHKGRKNTFTLISVALIVTIALGLFMENIIHLLIDLTGSERLASRLLVFSADNSGMDAAGESTLEARGNLWLVSLESWLTSPATFIFGIGDHNYLDFIDTAASGVGNHADLFDVFARYGIIGAFILYTTMKLLYDYCIQNYGVLLKREIQVFFVILLMIGFTKKIVSTEEAYIIFLLFPLCLIYIKNKVICKC